MIKPFPQNLSRNQEDAEQENITMWCGVETHGSGCDVWLARRKCNTKYASHFVCSLEVTFVFFSLVISCAKTHVRLLGWCHSKGPFLEAHRGCLDDDFALGSVILRHSHCGLVGEMLETEGQLAESGNAYKNYLATLSCTTGAEKGDE